MVPRRFSEHRMFEIEVNSNFCNWSARIDYEGILDYLGVDFDSVAYQGFSMGVIFRGFQGDFQDDFNIISNSIGKWSIFSQEGDDHPNHPLSPPWARHCFDYFTYIAKVAPSRQHHLSSRCDKLCAKWNRLNKATETNRCDCPDNSDVVSDIKFWENIHLVVRMWKDSKRSVGLAALSRSSWCPNENWHCRSDYNTVSCLKREFSWKSIVA